MDAKLKALLTGIFRTLVVCTFTGILMFLLGQWQDHKSAVFVSLLYLPLYFIYKIYIKKEKKE
jgi:4-hydroxybenzoate polyprenyltransferase